MTLAGHERAVQAVVSGLAATLDTLATHRAAVGATLRRLPGTLGEVRGTLARANGSIAGLQRLTDALAPGARELRRTAPPLADLERRLGTAAPLLETTLQRATPAAGPIARFLGATVPVAGQARAAVETLTPMLACIRPYGPELAGVLSTWSGFGMHYDALGHYARAELQLSPFTSNSTGLAPDQVAGVLPGLSYARPRAPGLNAGQPWWQPQCGVSPESRDPHSDPELGK